MKLAPSPLFARRTSRGRHHTDRDHQTAHVKRAIQRAERKAADGNPGSPVCRKQMGNGGGPDPIKATAAESDPGPVNQSLRPVTCLGRILTGCEQIPRRTGAGRYPAAADPAGTGIAQPRVENRVTRARMT